MLRQLTLHARIQPHRLPKVPATRRVILAAGASFDRLTISFVVPRAGMRLNLLSHKVRNDVEFSNPAPPLWWLMDIALVAAHVVIVVGAPLPLIMVALYADALAALFVPWPAPALGATSDTLRISLYTLMSEPWHVPQALATVSPAALTLLIIGAMTVLVGLTELLWYYLIQDLALKPEEALRRKPPSAARRQLQRLLMLLWAFQICGCIGYISLVAVWAILGAMVAPALILPYAAATGTFVSLAIAKWHELSTMRRTAEETIRCAVLLDFASSSFVPAAALPCSSPAAHNACILSIHTCSSPASMAQQLLRCCPHLLACAPPFHPWLSLWGTGKRLRIIWARRWSAHCGSCTRWTPRQQRTASPSCPA